MVYKKYIKRNGKIFGPYSYHSRKINGKVITEYHGKHEKKHFDKFLLISVFALLFFSVALIFLLNPNYVQSAKDIAFNSVNSITGFATEEITEEPVEEIISEEQTETFVEEIVEEIPVEIPTEEIIEIEENQTEIVEEIPETPNETIFEENTTEEVAEEIIEIPEILENETEVFVNETIEILNETLEILNETVFNETIIENLTQENLTINTIQFQAVLNQPVKWKKEFVSDEIGNITITLPEISENVVVKKIKDDIEEEINYGGSITGAVVGSQDNFILRFFENILGRITGNVVDENGNEILEENNEIEIEVEIDEIQAEYEIEYETPAPYAIEQELSDKKIISISGPEEIHYTDVLAYTNLSENLNVKNANKVRIHWIENNSYLTPISVEDKDGNGIYDYAEWIVPHLSNQTFEIIVITKAEHLDENYTFISDIYNDVFELDDIWSETIEENHFVRVTFEMNLTSANDITIYPRIASGNPRVEIYENGGTEILAEFSNITENEYNKIYLTNLGNKTQDVFDLRVVSGSLEFDHIVDPTIQFSEPQGFGDMNLAPLDNTTFVIAYINSSPAGAFFEIWNTSGTRELGPISFNTTPFINPDISRVAIASVNSTSFFIAYTNATGALGSELFMGWRRSGTNYTAEIRFDGAIGNRFHDLSLTTLTNTTKIGLCFVDQVEDDADVNFFASTDGRLLGTEVSSNAALNISNGINSPGNFTNLFDCVAMNNSIIVAFEFDLGAENDTTFHVISSNVSNTSTEVVTDADIDAAAGPWMTSMAQVSVASLNNTVYALVWSNASSLRLATRTALNTALRGPVPIVEGGITNTRLDTGTVFNIQTGQDNLVVAWYNSSSTNIVFQIFNQTANATTTQILVDGNASAGYANKAIAVVGQDDATGQSLCTGAFVIAYSNSTNSTLYQSFWYNGSRWSGSCEIADLIAPSLNITVPEVNNTNTSNVLQNINFTLFDNIAVESVWYSNDTYAVNLSLGSGGVWVNLSNLTWEQGKHNVTIYVNDTVGNLNYTTRSFTVDNTNPSLNITLPENNTNTTNTFLDVNFTFSDSFTMVDSCWYSNDSYTVNISLGSGGICTNITDIVWSPGFHNVRIYINDTVNNVNLSHVLFYTDVDVTNPDINITQPAQNNTNTSSATYDVNYTFFDSNINHIWYSNDTYTINRSLGSGGTYTNLSNITWSEGKHNVTIWANDTAGNLNQSSISFAIDTVNPLLNITFPVVNNSFTTSTGMDINFTFSDDGLGVDSCWYSNATAPIFNHPVNYSLGSGGTCTNVTNLTWVLSSTNFVRIYVNDTVGNINRTSITFTHDVIPPSVTIVVPATNNTNASNVNQDINFTRTDTNLQSCWYSNDTYLVNTTLASCGNITAVVWSEGKHNLTVWANDSSNNVGFAARSFTVDTVLPAISILFPSTNNTNTTNVNYNINFTSADSGSGLFNFWYNNDTYSVANKSLGVFGTSFNITNLTWTEGKHNVTIWANDSAGNYNFTTISFTLDNTNPSLNITFPQENFTNTTDILIDVNFTFSDSFTMVDSCWYSNDTYLVNKSLGSGGTCTNITNLTWSFAIHNVTIYVNDTLGNLNYTTRTINISTSNVAPETSITYPQNISYTVNVSVLNYTVFDDNSALSSCWYSLNSGFTNITITCGQNVSNLNSNQGSNIWTIWANDSEGLENFSSVTFFKDTISPNVDFVSPTTAIGNYSKNSIDANVTASDSGVGLAWINISLYNSTGIYQSNFSATSPLFVNYTNLPDGTYKLNATANDTLNNRNFTETRTITLDTTFPSVNITFPTSNNTNSTNVNLDVNYTRFDANLNSCWYSNDTYNVNTTLANCGNITVVVWSEGKHNVTIWANDTFNNVNKSSISFTIDSVNPDLTIVFPSNKTNTTNNLIDVNFTTFDLNIASCWYANDTFNVVNKSLGSGGTCVNITNITWGEGSHNVRIYVNDTLGNFNQSSVSFTVDTFGPNITFISPTTATGNYSRNSINANVTSSDATTLVGGINISLYNSTGIYQSNFSSNSLLFVNFTNLPDGTYKLNATANDTLNNRNFTETRTVTLDNFGPAISFVPITESNNSQLTRNNIQINISASDALTAVNSITINLYNTTSLVYSNNSTASVLFVNITGLADDTYYFNSTANDSAGNINRTETRTATIDTGAPSVDFVAPTENSGVYKSRSNIQINVSATDPNLNNINLRLYDSAHLQIRNNISSSSPYFINYTSLADGIYFYNASANDTIGNNADTATRNITLDSTNPSITSATENPSDPQTYSLNQIYEFNATITDANLDSVLMQFNGTNYSVVNSIGNVFNFTISGLGAGTYNYKWFANDSAQNANTSSGTYTINQASGNVFTYLNHTRANISIAQGVSIYLNGTLQNGTGNIKLYNNGILINQGTSPLSNLTTFNTGGSFNVTTIYEGNQNFTQGPETFYVTVLDIVNPNVNLTYPNNVSYNSVQTQLNYTVSDNSAMSSCWYTLNNGATNVTITCGQNVTGLNSGQGSSTWRVYVNDTSNNLNSSNVTFFVDSINPDVEYVSPTDTNNTSFGRNFIRVNVSASDANLANITIRLYNSTKGLIRENVSTSSIFFINYTSLSAGEYFFNATTTDVLNNKNYTSTRNISLILPTISITRPENKTYLSNISIPLNFTYSSADSFWFNLDNGANTTITGNTSFNISQGGHRLNLFANNSIGTTTANISFSVNSTIFSITQSEYNGTNKGNSTDFSRFAYEEIQNISGIILEDTAFGKISFNENINVTNDENISDDSIDLDSHINISENRIEINSSALQNFNKSATLSLYGLTFSNPRVLRDGQICSSSICTEQSYSGGTFVFNVTGFTIYSAEETPSTISDSGQGGSSGSGSTGGSVTSISECTTNEQCSESEVCINSQCVELFDIKILTFESPAKLGDFFDFTYFVKGMANINDDVVIKFWIERNGETVSSGSDTIFLGSLDEKTETAQIFLPSVVEDGIYQFKISVSRREYTAEASRTIEIGVDREKGIATITAAPEGLNRNLIYAIIVLLAVLALSGMGARRYVKRESTTNLPRVKRENVAAPRFLDILGNFGKKKDTGFMPKISPLKLKKEKNILPGLIYSPPAGKKIDETHIQKTIEDLMEGVRTKTLEKNRQRKDSEDILADLRKKRNEKPKAENKQEKTSEQKEEKSENKKEEMKDSDDFLNELK